VSRAFSNFLSKFFLTKKGKSRIICLVSSKPSSRKTKLRRNKYEKQSKGKNLVLVSGGSNRRVVRGADVVGKRDWIKQRHDPVAHIRDLMSIADAVTVIDFRRDGGMLSCKSSDGGCLAGYSRRTDCYADWRAGDLLAQKIQMACAFAPRVVQRPDRSFCSGIRIWGRRGNSFDDADGRNRRVSFDLSSRDDLFPRRGKALEKSSIILSVTKRGKHETIRSNFV